MPLIDTTFVTSQLTSQLPKIAAQVNPTQSRSVSASDINQFVSLVAGRNVGSQINSLLSLADSNSTTRKLKQDAVNFANSQLGSVNNTLRTITNTFGGSTTLASSISSFLNNIFDNKNNPQASNRTTLISDPIATNILKTTPPKAGSFRVTSVGTGTTAIGGDASIFGSRDLQMIGTIASTLLNRFDIDSTSNLTRTLTNSFGANRINGLFGSASSGTISQIGTIANIVTNRQSLRTSSNPISQVTSAISAIFNNFNQSQTQNRNDFGNYISRASGLSNALGGVDVSSYYTKNPDYSLLSETGTYVNTQKSGVDAQTANSIRGLLRFAGVQNIEGSYDSAHEQASAFNIGLIAASVNGMSDEVTKLTALPFAASTNGQQSLSDAFTAVSNSNLTMASTLLTKIDQPNQFDTNSLTKSLLTNKNLKSSDTSTLNTMLTDLGTTFDQAISISSISASKYPVYDASFVTQINPTLLDTYLPDKSVSNYFDGTEISFDKNGQLTI